MPNPSQGTQHAYFHETIHYFRPGIVMNYHFAGFCASIGFWFHASHFHTLCEFKYNWLEPAKRSQMKAQQTKTDLQT